MAEEQSAQNLIDESANLADNVDPVLEKSDYISTDEGEKGNHGDHLELELSKPTEAVEDPQYRSPADVLQPVEDTPSAEPEAEPMDTSVHEDPLLPVEGEEGEKSCETDDQLEQAKKDEGSANDSEEVDRTSAEVLPTETPGEARMEGPEEQPVEARTEDPVEASVEEQPVETRMEEPVPEEPEVIRVKINIKTQSDTNVVSVGPDATVAELKLAVSSSLKLSIDRICLIYSGKMLLDEETLQLHDISDDSTVYLIVRPRQPPVSDSSTSSSFPFGPVQFSTLGTTPLNFTQLQQQLQKQMMNNPEMVRQMVDNPLVQQLMANPAVMKEMMMSAPQSRELLERNPEISDLLNNPEVMKQTLDMARNPAVLETLLTQVEQERASNLADGSTPANVPSSFNIPGFNLGANSTVSEPITLLQQLASNPQVVQQMLQAPYMPTIMEGLTKNPHWAQQMISQNPLFSGNPHLQQQMSVMMPYYIQQMQNPEMQTLMTNPKALQAMLRIQQGMNVLQSEAPNLASSVGLPYLSVPSSAASYGAMSFPTAAADAARGNTGILGAQYDPFSVMMSQIIQQMANRQMTQPPEQRYVEQLDRLSLMGFPDRETNLQVLIGTFGDVTAAVEHLMRARSS